jgi:hypothetical protein
MTDKLISHEKTRQPGNEIKEKRKYHKPTFRFERVFETQALSCGKIISTSANCQFSQKTS